VDILDGNDPAAERRTAEGSTVAALADVYIERHAKVRKKTWKEDERRIKKHVIPAIGSRQLREVKREDISAFHTEIGRRTPVEANRVLALASVMFSLAEQWGFLPEGHPNPCKSIEPFREKSRDRYVTPTELPRLAEAINEEPNVYIRGALWLYLLTGVRKTELLNARWVDVSFERRELRLEETKAGRAHVVPLSHPALRILRELPRQRDNPWIFPGALRGQPLRGFAKNWRAIRVRAGLEDLRLHDLRRTVGSWLAMGGASLPLIGKVLDHSNPSTTQIYARLTDDSARQALEQYAQELMEAINDES
jgi:integrase